jgi:hypothetical protein
MAGPILVYALISLSAFFPLLTPAPGSVLYAMVLIPGLGALYGAAAILQLQYQVVRSWRPAWGQGLAVAWVGGWLLFAVGSLIRALRRGGVDAVGESLGSWALVLGLFIVLPWTLAFFRTRSRRPHR